MEHLTPREMKTEIQHLSAPIIEFMKKHEIVSFYFLDASGGYDISARPINLPNKMKSVLSVDGSIYILDKE